MDITELVASLPDNTENEALNAVHTMLTNPYNGTAVIRCHLSAKFTITAALANGLVTLGAEQWPARKCQDVAFVDTLTRMIYEIDEAMSKGYYHPRPKPPANYYPDDRPPPPPEMDIPVWDNKKQRWYDAEY